MAVQRRYGFIDALRGVAVLMVVAAHVPVPPGTGQLYLLSAVGAYGVQLFFIVSAFTLFLSMDVKWDRERHPALSFAIRRFFRIAPAFYCAGCFYLLRDGAGPQPFAPEGVLPLHVITTLLFINGWRPDTINAIVPGGWSIAVEMTFYVFVPVLFLRLRSLSRAVGLSMILALVGLVLTAKVAPLIMAHTPGNETTNYWFPRLWFPAQACVFPIGMALFFIHKEPQWTVSRRSALGLLLLSAYFTVAFVDTDVFLVPTQLTVSIALAVGFFAASQLNFSRPFGLLLRHAGKVSFSVYLLHFWMIDLVSKYLSPLWASTGPYIGYGLFYSSVTLLACTLATGTYLLIEQPGQALGRRLIQVLQRSEPLLDDSQQTPDRGLK